MASLAQKNGVSWPFQAAQPPCYPTIWMCDPRDPHNVGAAVRAASCFGLGQVWISGRRCAERIWNQKRIPREERMKGFRDVDIILEAEPLHYLSAGTPVAVELLPGAQNLLTFAHPESAIYLFGPEDGHVPTGVRGLCHHRIFIPTKHCTNLAAAIYLVLYDRLMKQYLAGSAASLPIDEVLAETRGWPDNHPDFVSMTGRR